MSLIKVERALAHRHLEEAILDGGAVALVRKFDARRFRQTVVHHLVVVGDGLWPPANGVAAPQHFLHVGVVQVHDALVLKCYGELRTTLAAFIIRL